MHSSPMIMISFMPNIVGLGLCTLDPLSVILTDFEEVVPLLQCNIKLNSFMVRDPCLQRRLRSKFFATALCWGTELDPMGRLIHGDGKIQSDGSNTDCSYNGNLDETAVDLDFDCDLVIASDVVYDPAGYEPLVQTLCVLLKGEYRELIPHDRSSRRSVLESSTVGTKETLATSDPQDEQVKNELVPHIHRGPICILAHRHRHPENER